MQRPPVPLVTIARVCIRLQPTTLTARQGTCTSGAFFVKVDYFRVARQNEAACATDATLEE
jgi:hypothetical protein